MGSRVNAAEIKIFSNGRQILSLEEIKGSLVFDSRINGWVVLDSEGEIIFSEELSGPSFVINIGCTCVCAHSRR